MLLETWKDPGMISEIERLIKDAGFGHGYNERAFVSLTEAEAAAVYALKSGMAIGETFVVCDAGGGTSDVNVLRVRSTGPMELEALSYTEGKAVGSTLIDFKIRQLIECRLERIRQHLPVDLEKTVDKMMLDFPSYKCNFGDERYNRPKFPLPVPELQHGMEIPEANIEDSNMIITRSASSGDSERLIC